MKSCIYPLRVFVFLLLLGWAPAQLFGQSYCKPSFSGCSAGDSILFFQFGSFSKSPGCVSGSVDTSGVKSSVITVYRGKTYALKISSSSYYDCFGLFIDYNKNGGFSDPGEMVGLDNNGNGLISSYSAAVTIPIDATPQVTRMRAMVTAGAASLDYNTTCNSYSTGGEAADYLITIAAYPNDVGIMALNAPQNLSCPSSSEKIQITIRNIGTNNLTNIPFVLKFGSATIKSTYTRTLKSNTTDTFTVGFINASTSGTYSFQVYANLSGDGDNSNDTLNASVDLKQAAAPVTKNVTQCGGGFVYLQGASTSKGSVTHWFSNMTSDTVIGTGDSLRSGYLNAGDSASYYAESWYPNNGSITKGNWSTARVNYGSFFDVFAKRDISIDSLDENFSSASGSKDSAIIYYRKGSYVGYERSPSYWTKFASISVTTSGPGNPTRVRFPKTLNLEGATTYGFYVMTVGGVNYDTTGSSLSGKVKSNGDLTITAGATVASRFAATGSVSPGRDWDGTLYYDYAVCNSARKVAKAYIYQSPRGAVMAKSSPFQGQFNTGDQFDPDNICLGDTNVYQITSPKGLSNSDYGTKWVFSGLSFKTFRGTASKDTLFKLPATSKNAYFRFTPKGDADSVFIFKVHIKTLPGGCDSLFTRYIHIRVKPTADFGFSNACVGSPVSFGDSSRISISSVSQWFWDFGDSATDTGKNPTHAYAKAGNYTVTLTSASAEGCGSTVSKMVTQYPLPHAQFGYSLSCNNLASVFGDSSSISPGTISTWNWNFGDGGSATGQNPSYAYSKSGPYEVKLVVVSGFGCKDSVSSKIRILPRPVAKFTVLNECIGAPLYTANTSIDSSHNSTYLWDFGDGSTSVKSSPSHTYSGNGTYKIILKTTSAAGCSDTVSQYITPYPKPVPVITYTPACAGRPVSFIDSGGSGNSATHEWTFGDGKSTLAKSILASHAYAQAGTYSVLLVITNAGGCVDSQRMNITVPGYPSAGFTATSVCVGKTTDFTNTSADLGTGGTYVWDFGDQSPRSNTQNPTHKYSSAGGYNVTLAAINQYGCLDSFSKTITVNAPPAIDKWTRDQKGYTVTFIPKDTTIGSFVWYFGTLTGDSSSKKKPTFTYPTADARYQVKLLVTNSFGCSSTLTDSVFTGKYGIIPIQNTFPGASVFPNPFKGSTSISYTLSGRCRVTIRIFDIQGKQVALLKDGYYDPGHYTDVFDASKYRACGSVYLLKMEAGGQVYSAKILDMR